MQIFSVGQLERKFKKCGQIERIELHTDKYFEADESNQYPNYAYLTFTKSISTHAALTDKILKRQPFRIEPANTWKQPVCPFQPSGSNYFDMLDDYSLLEIFSQCRLEGLTELAEVSQRFHRLLHEKVFKNQKKVKIDGSGRPTGEYKLQLSKIRNQQLAHGKYAEVFEFRVPFYEDKRIICRMMDLFSKHVGDNVRELNIHGVIITDKMMRQLKGIFENLRILRWYGQIDYRYEGAYTFEEQMIDTDLRSTCVNLEELEVIQKHVFTANSGPWKKLKKIHIGFCRFTWNEDQDNENFFSNNPQLTALKILYDEVSDILQHVTRHLENLESLHIYKIWSSVDNLSLLALLYNLRKLSLDGIEADTKTSISKSDYKYFSCGRCNCATFGFTVVC